MFADNIPNHFKINLILLVVFCLLLIILYITLNNLYSHEKCNSHKTR